MVRKIVPRMVEWEKSDMANVVVVKGAGDRALCAGGDVAALAKDNLEKPEGWKTSADYFGLEYKLDHLVATYGKPYVSFMDGITMGGGVGLSMHAPFRVATERTVFAMPETTIGFFPDVGASFFLPRLDGAVGTYLALTSERLTGANVLYSGVATHYLHSSSLPDVEARLSELQFRDDDTLAQRLALVNATLNEFSTGLPHDQPMQIAGDIRRAVDRCFGRDSVDAIVEALKAERATPQTEEWAQRQLQTLTKRSPTSVHVALRQMRAARDWDIAETFRREHQMATRFMQHPDFSEGVTALLVRKEKPTWQPASLEDVKDSKAVTDPFFAYDEKAKLDLLSDRTYDQYPHAQYGVPSERDVERLINAPGATPLTPKQLFEALVAPRHGQQGISAVLKDIFERKVVVDDKGHAKWVDVAAKL